MVQAATKFTGLGFPVLVFLPNVPLIPAFPGSINFLGFAPRGLGLGDFFFAGVLAIQTFKKFGKKIAFISIAAMAVAFGIWEAFLPNILALAFTHCRTRYRRFSGNPYDNQRLGTYRYLENTKRTKQYQNSHSQQHG